MGSLGYKDKPAFDDSLPERDEYRYSGKTGTGIAWEGKVERHIISRAPVMIDIFRCAEERGAQEEGGHDKITEDNIA